MAKAIDIGTCFLVGAEMQNGKEVFTTERDAFFSMPNEDFAEEMLTKAGAAYLTRSNTLYVVGDDALKFSLVTGNRANYRRPMARGVLNPGEEEAVSMIQVLIEGVIGRANYEGEVCAATIPANPLDGDFNTTYHKMVLERFLTSLGYRVKILNEALAMIYAENPTIESNGMTIPFTGIGISFGAGMVNLVASWRAKKLLEFSVSRGGDWIDKEVAKVRGIPESKVTHLKETRLDFTQQVTDQTLRAVEIYYEELIRYVMEGFAREFKATSAHFEEPIEIIVGGGTSAVPGMIDKFMDIINTIELPMTVKNVRLAKDPLKVVASGALIAGISEEKKTTRTTETHYDTPQIPVYTGNIEGGYTVHRPGQAPAAPIPKKATTTRKKNTQVADNDPALTTKPRKDVLQSVDDSESFSLDD
ncbi:hypothetical protein ACFL54_03505 [Planctomycetota bacterium]